MSWSLFLKDITAEEFGKTLDETVVAGGDGSHETNNQISIARQLALRIFQSDQLGEPTADTLYMVSLSGHSNPSHVLVGGGASESIGVNVSRYVPMAPVAPPVIAEPTIVSSATVEMAAHAQLAVPSASVIQATPVHMQLAIGRDESNDLDDDAEPEQAPAETASESDEPAVEAPINWATTPDETAKKTPEQLFPAAEPVVEAPTQTPEIE